jgi:hypothetical protein
MPIAPQGDSFFCRAKILHTPPQPSRYLGGMRADDLTRGQARALKNKLEPMVAYLNRLGKRMDSRGFRDDDPARILITDALKALYKLRAEMECRSIDGRGIEDKPKQPTIEVC